MELFECIQCIVGCGECCSSKDSKESEPFLRFMIPFDYRLDDEKCVRNAANHFYCMICKEEILTTVAIIAECVDCHKYVGHIKCVTIMDCLSCRYLLSIMSRGVDDGVLS